MKKNHKILGTALTVTAATLAAAGSMTHWHSPVAHAQKQARHTDLSFLFAEATAGDSASDSCRTAFQAVLDDAPAKDSYANHLLDHLHHELYRLNNVQPADIEMIFCRLINILEVDPDLTALPQTITKTDPIGGTIAVTVSAPEETFATTLGYTAKAELKYNDTTFMTLWWAGSEDSSKGYLIQGSNPMKSDGNKRLRYAQWDRTSDTQTVKFFGTQFATSYLTTPAAASTSATGGDHAHYGRLTYDTAAKTIDMQSVEIRGDKTNSSSFVCVRTYFNGTLGGTVSGYRPDGGNEEAVSGTNTDGSGMDGKTGVTDALTTAESEGTHSAGSTLTTGTFDKSCADVNGAGATGQAFAGNAVDFTLAPSEVFAE